MPSPSLSRQALGSWVVLGVFGKLSTPFGPGRQPYVLPFVTPGALDSHGMAEKSATIPPGRVPSVPRASGPPELQMPSLSMSGSQASPTPSPSVSAWFGFGVLGQLSQTL